MKHIATGMALAVGSVLLTGGPVGATGTPAGHGLAQETVDCTDGVSGDALRSQGLAVWMDGSHWLVTSFSSDAVSWSKPTGNGAAKGRSVTCEASDGAKITMVELPHPTT